MTFDEKLDYIIRSNPAVVVGHDAESMKPENIPNMIEAIKQLILDEVVGEDEEVTYYTAITVYGNDGSPTEVFSAVEAENELRAIQRKIVKAE